MQLIYFTKFLKGLNPDQVAETAVKLGFRGLDLAIRSGQAVNPDNVEEALPKAMEVWKKAGLSVPLVTMETRWTDPGKKEVETLYHACAAAKIPYIKLGYWTWRPEKPYGEGL